MEKKFSKIEIAVINTTAKNAAKYVAMKQKVEKQIEEVEAAIRKRVEEKLNVLTAERDKYQSIINSLNTPVRELTGGYTTEDLVDIRKEPTGQIDAKTGKEIFKTVYALKYPDTVVPPQDTAVPTTADGPGSDFDIDAENMKAEMPEEALDPDPEYAAQREEAETAFADNNEW